MARMRSVKPEFWTDRKLARLSRDARLLYIALWNQADEWGRVQGDTRYVKGHCLPYDDDLSLGAIDHLIGELEAAGRVLAYSHDGDPYLLLPFLAKHQRLEPHKVPSRLPEPPLTSTSESRATSSERRADEHAPDATSSETIVALHVAGGMEHVAGGMYAADLPVIASPATTLSEVQRAQRLTADYTKVVPLSNFAAVLGIVRKAIKGQYADEAIAIGLAHLASEGRPVTADTLRIAMDGLPPSRSGSTPDTGILQRAMQRAEQQERGA